MIGYIAGKIIEKQPPLLIIDVNGLGYEVHVTMNTIYQLPEVGQFIKLYTHFIVREDLHLLFGFVSDHERSLFRKLIKVSGIGPKTALTMLSSLTANEFITMVLRNDVSSLKKLPGIGAKTAERLVIEMRDKFKDLDGSVDLTFAEKFTNPRNQIENDAVSALISLGYKPQDASKMVTKHVRDDLNLEEIIRLSLRDLS